METNQNIGTPSGYRVEYVLLLDSDFKRAGEISLKSAITYDINLTPTPFETDENNKFTVSLLLSFEGKSGEETVCTSNIKMLGGFEKYGEPILTDDKFKAINAPAIIYPFIREHLHNLCQKSGIPNVLLPTVNFKP